ncbi:protein OSCP1a isoform X1 [Ictalurus punctatus]|uniref:Protein OSCP1a isoform X1 n=1 Tax=Ictalurus punctatus TaxID=7998 RepID=A0A2D0SCU6_ICTPU|nr:protein OSCP1a isoform X1 [Ictalurus punctatus]
MSLRTLPLLIINLGGEMLYILDQRLRARNESDDKIQKGWSEDDRKRVMNDIVGVMFCKGFMEESMQPQDMYSHRALRYVLTRLAHTSIMRLNSTSMDRMYDLMTMAFKYQIALCPRPRDLLLVSFNHMDGVRELVKDNPRLVNLINEAQRLIIEMYTPLSDGEFQLIRQTLLAFFQDMRVRVSIFLKENLQNADGSFAIPTSGPVPHGSEVPGLIRYVNSRGRLVRRREFVSGGSYTSTVRDASFDVSGDRVTRLGTNMYGVSSAEDTHTSGSSKHTCKRQQVCDDPNPLAKAELNLLAKLMGQMEVWDSVGADGGMRVNLFPSDQEEDEEGRLSAADEACGVVSIQAVKADTELTRIAAQFTDQDEAERPSDKGEDLLAMMDEL